MPLSDNSVDVLRVFCPATGTCGGGGGGGKEEGECVVVLVIVRRDVRWL